MTEQEKIYQEIQAKHVRLRTIHEGYVETLANGIRQADDAILAKLDLPEHELSLQGFIPEYYKEVPDEAAFLQQRLCYNRLVEQWNAAVDDNYQEMVRCLSELEQAYGLR